MGTVVPFLPVCEVYLACAGLLCPANVARAVCPLRQATASDASIAPGLPENWNDSSSQTVPVYSLAPMHFF